ncbi:MAG TPA: phosphatase PAP2 family protein, partial [Anaeromyxobacteraceae bacterium]
VLVLALLGGLSRIYVGAHWVTDVLGGWALGGSLGLLAYLLARWAWPEGHLARLARERRARACGAAASGARASPL